MKKSLCFIGVVLFSLAATCAEAQWEKQGDYYYLRKQTREYFSATAAGANKFTRKYATYNDVGFLVRGADDWRDYGRIDLEGNTTFSLPIRSGMRVEEIHLLSGGNVGNRYEHDKLLHLYGDNYYYGVLTLMFAYQDGIYKEISVPVFWDWFHLGAGEWAKDGARIISLGNNPVRKDCSMYHVIFTNPRPAVPLKDIILSDSWLGDKPFSEVFALTLKSSDLLEAASKEDREYKSPLKTAAAEPADKKAEWLFNDGLDGWIAGCSENWDIDAAWQAESFGKKGVVMVPACSWAGNKFSWIEKKIALPSGNKIEMHFQRHSAAYSQHDKQWTDGLLRIIVKGASGSDLIYEKLYNGEWGTETADLSRYKGQTVIIRFENHGAGTVRLSDTTSPACDAEDAVIDEIRIQRY